MCCMVFEGVCMDFGWIFGGFLGGFGGAKWGGNEIILMCRFEK